MARMMRANSKPGLCDCLDCGMGAWVGRAKEKQQWQRDLNAEGRAEALGQALEDFADASDWQYLMGA